jgi:hypothetical protein
MGFCRHCGRGVRGSADSTVCAICAEAVLCDRCGHTRAEHVQVFVRGVVPACNRRVGDVPGLASWGCGCPGFSPAGVAA